MSYISLSPSIFFVSIIACFRGYFQGYKNMYPSAISEIIEQVVKCATGIVFAFFLVKRGFTVLQIMPYILFAVTISEFVAVVFLWIVYKKTKPKMLQLAVPYVNDGEKIAFKTILKVSIPITLSVILLPLSNIIDSIIIVRGISQYSRNATSLFGLFSGCALTIVNLPVSICYGLAVSITPLVASLFAKGEVEKANEKIVLATKYTSFIGVPASLFVYVFAEQIVSFLFGSLQGVDYFETVSLLKIMWLVPLLLSVVQTLSSCLAGIGKAKKSAIAMLFAVVVKTVILSIFIKNQTYNIEIAGFATLACYFIALIFNLLYSIKGKNIQDLIPFALKTFICGISAGLITMQFKEANIILIGITFIAIYFIFCKLFKVFDKDEMIFFKVKGKENGE